MSVWIKQGVQGDLNNKAQKALGKVARLFGAVGDDLFITSIRDGNHGKGSLHYIGDAFDIRYPPKHPRHDILKADIKHKLGKDFDVVAEGNHIHIEYDPK